MASTERKRPDSAKQKPPDSTARKRPDNAERQRLDEADTRGVPWRRWGPYLSERQWGTVREDYGGGQDTWSSTTHEQARSRAYRWGEEGLAGLSDEYFHGDNGAGIGASHQTGWTGTVALLPLLFRSVHADALLNLGDVVAAGGTMRQKAATRRTAAGRRTAKS